MEGKELSEVEPQKGIKTHGHNPALSYFSAHIVSLFFYLNQ